MGDIMTQSKPESVEYPRILMKPPGPKGQAVVDKDKQYSSTSYIKYYPLVVSHGAGAMVEDLDGNRYIDFMAGIGVSATGYNHPEVVKAIKDAAGKFLHMCGTDFYYEGMADVCERLAKSAPGESPKRVFLTNSGTEAVEGAIKLVRNSTRRPTLVAFNGAFHGRSYGAMSLTASKTKQRATFGPMLPGIYHVPYPDPYRLGPNASDIVFEYIEKELFKRYISPTEIAAFFIEPMLGEGGYVLPPDDFLPKLAESCKRHGILLVFDEIQTGMGRTGKMWAAEHYGVEPDVLLTAKGIASGMPLGAIIAREDVMRWPSGSHGSTFGGNPVCCAAALATMDVIERDLLSNTIEMGDLLKAGVEKLAQKHLCIGDVRGKGLFIGVEFVKDRETKEPAEKLTEKIAQLAFERGLLLLSCGLNVIRLAPPLVLNRYDVEKGLEILDSVLTDLEAAES